MNSTQLNPERCLGCNEPVKDISSLGVLGVKYFSCPSCGRYGLDSFARHSLDGIWLDDRQRAAVRHLIRTRERRDDPYVFRKDVKTLLENLPLPKPAEQAALLLLHVGKRTTAGEEIDFHYKEEAPTLGCVNQNGTVFIVQSLERAGLISTNRVMGSQIRISLTLLGWQRFEELQRRDLDSRRGFMAMDYRNVALREILEDHLKPAARLAGFELDRLDDKPEAGNINVRMLVEIRRSRFVVADLTDGNKGAYWEAGFAEGLGLPVIYTCEKSVFHNPEVRHFDVKHQHTIEWTADNPQGFAEVLKATIRNTLPLVAKLSEAPQVQE